MKKRITKSIAVLLSVLFLLSLSALSGNAASYIVDGDWKYEMTVGNNCYYIAEYLGNDSRVTIPSLYNEKPVVKVNPYSFLNNSSIHYVNFPATITEIGESAFYGCTGLKTVQITQYVEKIGSSAFYGCTSLTGVTIDAGTKLKTISAHSFNGCTKLASVTLPHGIQSIGEYAFNNCEKLTSVIIPGSVTSIGNTSFYKAENLTVYGWSGTYAEAYTTEMKIPFYSFGEYVEPTTAAPTTVPATTVAPTTTVPETTVAPTTTAPETTTPVVTDAPETTTPVVTDAPETTTPVVTDAPETTTPVSTAVPTTVPAETTVPTTSVAPVDTITLYFLNNKNWDPVYAYYWWDRTDNGGWPGEPAVFVRTNAYGQDVYSVEVPENISGVVFNNGVEDDSIDREQSTGITNNNVTFTDGLGFYLTERDESNVWLYETFIYTDTDPEVSTTVVSTDTDTTASQVTTAATTGDPLVTENSFPTIPVHTLPGFTDTDDTYPVTTTVTETTAGNQYLIGDVDLDGKVTVKDATLIQKFTAQIVPLNNIQKYLGNVNSKGGLNVQDATIIQKYVAEYPIDYPVGHKVYI